MVGHRGDRDILDRIGRLLEEERRLARRVRAHLARVRCVVAANAVDAANRKGHVAADDWNMHGRHLEGRLGTGLGDSRKRAACDRTKSEGGGSLENRSAIHKVSFC